MNVVIVFAILAIVLFVFAFLTRRRFGLLGLALAAGSVLSGIWSFSAGLLVSSLSIVPNGAMTTAVTLSIVTLLPAIVLLFHGPTYRVEVTRVIGALLFTVLALAFLVQPLGYVFNSASGVGAPFYEWLVSHRNFIIGFGLVLAVVDLFLSGGFFGEGKHGRR